MCKFAIVCDDIAWYQPQCPLADRYDWFMDGMRLFRLCGVMGVLCRMSIAGHGGQRNGIHLQPAGQSPLRVRELMVPHMCGTLGRCAQKRGNLTFKY